MDPPRGTGLRPVWLAMRASAALLAMAALAGTGPLLLDGMRPPSDPLDRYLILFVATLGAGLAVAAAGRWMLAVLRWTVLPLPFVAGIAWVKTTPSFAASALGAWVVAATMVLCYGSPVMTWLVRRQNPPQEGAMGAAARQTRLRVVGAISLVLTAAFLTYTARAIPDAAASGIIGVYIFQVLVVAAWPVLVLGRWAMAPSRSGPT